MAREPPGIRAGKSLTDITRNEALIGILEPGYG